MSELKCRIIALPTKKVLTKFHFFSGEKLEILTKENCDLEDKKERTANLISSSYYVKFTDFIVSTNHITHITFEYDDEDEEKPKAKEVFSLIAKIFHFVLICMLFIYTIFCFYILFKK